MITKARVQRWLKLWTQEQLTRGKLFLLWKINSKKQNTLMLTQGTEYKYEKNKNKKGKRQWRKFFLIAKCFCSPPLGEIKKIFHGRFPLRAVPLILFPCSLFVSEFRLYGVCAEKGPTIPSWSCNKPYLRRHKALYVQSELLVSYSAGVTPVKWW